MSTSEVLSHWQRQTIMNISENLCPEGSPGAACYELRLEGCGWKDVALNAYGRDDSKTTDAARKRAKAHAVKHSLPWPIRQNLRKNTKTESG